MTETVVLLVEDSTLMALTIEELLAGLDDISLIHCSDPTRVLEVARECNPTVALVDLVMPDLDGYGVTEQLRQSQRFADLPIVVLSVREEPEEKVKAFAAGANDYLVKVPHKSELAARVRYHSKAYRQQTELLAARDAALSASVAKSAFLANMSHEIRTPINGIIGLTNLALQSQDPQIVNDYLARVASSADLLLQLVNDILDFSKIEAGRLELDLHPFQLRQTVEKVADACAFQANAKGLEMQVAIDEELPNLLIGDAPRIQQVLLNLVSNGLKFTDSGRVEIQVRSQPPHPPGHQRLEFAVVDSGIGIARDRQASIFDAFTQADSSTTRRYGGTGLGLSISSQLVSKMEGRLTLESELGRGSSFSFQLTLPISEQSTEPAPAQATKLPSPPLRVLVAEDNLINQMVVGHLLESLGHTVVLAEDGAVALEKLEQEEFDILLVDLQMPRVDGYEVVIKLREKERETGQHLPAIALTAHAIQAEKERCLESGMDDFLTKPLEPEELERVLALARG